ncbi:hypothetical protein [Nitrospirillum amazonense]|uniref:hypothetical protein n=1 Tax=Nitrospirillum amazonense TaxID=28077 RepID=UPI0011A0C9F0|nr:hypothetical protein [Nitrospirillum amazonense]
MEDYGGASNARYKDFRVLVDGSEKRAIAAVHLGGIAVECQVKSLILLYHGINNWHEPSKKKKEPGHGTPVKRPSHDIVSAIEKMPDLYNKAKSDAKFLSHLSNIKYPLGITGGDFIELRYSELEGECINLPEWEHSLNYVKAWLDKNKVITK